MARSLLIALALLGSLPTARAAGEPHFGFTGFPYAQSVGAVDDVTGIVRDNGDLWAVHLDLDDCIPWTEALMGTPFPTWFQSSWNDERARIPATHKVSLAATPTSQDRRSLKAPCGASESEAGSYPSEFDEMGGIDPATGDAMAHPRVRDAYEAYVLRAVQTFSPDFLTIAIEITTLASLYPSEWPAFEGLVDQTRTRIHSEVPGLPVGVEHVLQTLLDPAVASLVKPQIERNDFLGISFYPFGSSFGEFFGDPPLDDPPQQWRNPLAWLKTYTTVPIAIVETGHTSQTLSLDLVPGALPFVFPGDESIQNQFVTELIQTARDASYLFVIWFIPVDYDPLFTNPGLPPGGQIWTWNGLFDSSLQEKTAGSTWQSLVVPEPESAAAISAVILSLALLADLRSTSAARGRAQPSAPIARPAGVTPVGASATRAQGARAHPRRS